MAALDFPNPPLTVGQTFTATNAVAYRWDGTVWALVPGPGASGPAGGDLTGFYPDPQIRPGAIVDTDITSVAWTKLIAPFLATIPVSPRGALAAYDNLVEWHGNVSGDSLYDPTKPSWLIRIDYGNDVFQVWRAAAGTSSWVILLQVALSGITMSVPIFLPANSVGSSQIIDGSIQAGDIAPGVLPPMPLDRAHLGVNAVNGGVAYQAAPVNFISSAAGWQPYVTLPTLTGRGGMVHLWAAACLSVTATAGGTVGSRWVRNGSVVVTDLHLMAGTAYSAVPNVSFLDIFAGAGALNYQYQVYLESGMTLVSNNLGPGACVALEVG